MDSSAAPWDLFPYGHFLPLASLYRIQNSGYIYFESYMHKYLNKYLILALDLSKEKTPLKGGLHT